MTCVLGSDRVSQWLKRRHHRHLHLGLINGIARIEIEIGKLELQFHLERVVGCVFLLSFLVSFLANKTKNIERNFSFICGSLNYSSVRSAFTVRNINFGRNFSFDFFVFYFFTIKFDTHKTAA